MRTITFYSYKGGVGRSLALSNIAIRLSEFKKKVCVLDFDLEAPGLQFKFHNYSRPPITKGIVDYIHEFSECGNIPHSIKDFSVELTPSNKFFEKINFIPAGNIDAADYWKKLSSINWSSMFYEEMGKGVKFFLDLKQKIKNDFNPDFLLIDSRTGITDISGVTLKILADDIVILAANNEENIYGSKKIIKSLTDPSHILFEKHPKITFILTRLPFTDNIKDKEKELSIIKLRTDEFRKTFEMPDFEILVIHSDRRLEEEEKPLIGDDYEAKGVSISNDYLKLFDTLTNDVLTQEEINIFRSKKNAEKQYVLGINATDNSNKISHFTNAILLDDTQYLYYLSRANIYYKLKEIEKAINDYEKALELNPLAIEVLINIAILFANRNNKKALDYLNKSIKINPNYWFPHYLQGWIYGHQKKFEQAKEKYDYILTELRPDSAETLNSRADLFRILGKYNEAYSDIFRAIEINTEVAMYYATLAEIYSAEGKRKEFYFNLNIALSKGIKVEQMKEEKEVYQHYLNDEKFISLMNKYDLDISELTN